MDATDLITRVRALAGTSGDEAERALRATISSLGDALSTDDAKAFGAELPGKLRALVRGASLKKAALRDAVGAGFAIEHTGSARRALSEQISPQLRSRMCRDLPRLASLCEWRGGA